AEQLRGCATGIAHNHALGRNPSGLTGMGVVRRRHDPILSLPVAARVLCLCDSTVDAFKVITMHEAPRLSNRGWQYGVTVKLCSTPVASEPTGGKVRTECA